MYAVLFDIDGTLIHTGGAGQLAFAETFAAEFGIPEISKSVSFAGRSDRAIAQELMSVHGIPVTPENWGRFRRAYLALLPGALGKLNGRVLPGVRELLDQLATMPDVTIGLLTGNLREGARCKLIHYGLDGRFAFGGFGDEATDRNEIARSAVAAAVHELCGSMVIGDTIHDVRCARAIEALAVAVVTGGSTREALAAENPDILVADLTDSAALYEAIQKGGC